MKTKLILLLIFYLGETRAQLNYDTLRLTEISKKASIFNLGEKYLCSFRFVIGKFNTKSILNNSTEILTGRLIKPQIVNLLDEYCKDCKTNSFGLIDQNLYTKLNQALDDGIYNLVLSYKTSQKEVSEINYLFYRQETYLILTYYRKLDESGNIER